MITQYQITRLQKIYQQGPEPGPKELSDIAREGMREVERRIAEERSRSSYMDEFRKYKEALCEAVRSIKN